MIEHQVCQIYKKKVCRKTLPKFDDTPKKVPLYEFLEVMIKNFPNEED